MSPPDSALSLFTGARGSLAIFASGHPEVVPEEFVRGKIEVNEPLFQEEAIPTGHLKQGERQSYITERNI